MGEKTIMWKEILIDNRKGLKKYFNLLYDVICVQNKDKILEIISISAIQNMLNKIGYHAYFYEDDILEVCSMYKYHIEYDRTVFFQYFFRFKKTNDIDYLAHVSGKGIKIILERHSKIHRCPKFGDEIYVERFGVTEKEYTEKTIKIFAEHGVRVIDHKNYWDYELI